MWWTAAAQFGLNLLSSANSYKAAKRQAAAQQAWQDYSNTMTNLSNGINQNAITQNEILANEASANNAVGIQKAGLISAAHAEVAAAAAGVKGRSVNQAIRSVQRSIATQEYDRQISLKNANAAFDQQRLQSAMGASMQQDYSYIPKPSGASYFLNALSNTAASSSFQGLFGGSGGSGRTGWEPSNWNTAANGMSYKDYLSEWDKL
jgi:hypothetical protein